MPPPMVYDLPAKAFNIGNDNIFMEDVTQESPKFAKLKKKTSFPKTHPDGAPLTAKPEHFDLQSCETDLPWKLMKHRKRRRSLHQSSNQNYNNSSTWMTLSTKF